MLDIPLEKFPGFINCYVKESGLIENKKVDFGNLIFILCKPIWTERGYKNLIHYDKNDLLLSVKYNNKLVILIFEAPKKFNKDYKKFLQGRYSKFSEEYKQQLLKYFPKYVTENGKKRLHNNYAIIYPDNNYRKLLEARLDVSLNENSEIYSKPDIEEETLNIDIIESLLYTYYKKSVL